MVAPNMVWNNKGDDDLRRRCASILFQVYILHSEIVTGFPFL